jgi:amino acid adenylation domain-containing protein
MKDQVCIATDGSRGNGKATALELARQGANEEDIFTFPTSFAQQRLWFVEQLDPGKAVYNIPYHQQTRWKGQLNVTALAQALNALVARHEPLRTTFMDDGGELVQVIRSEVNVSLPVIDLTHLHGGEQEVEVTHIVNEEARHTFDLENGPLFYARLLKLSDEEHVFIFMVHHIVVDASSLDFMAEELAALYEAFVAGKEANLPKLPLQYADFVIWQREWMQEDVLQTQIDYWKEQLSGRLPVLELPTDRPRPKRQQNNGSWEWFHLPPTLGQQLRDFSRNRGVSLYITMLAAFKVLLHRHSGQEEIVIGSPTANRTRSELEKLIGFFTNPVVLRTSFADDPTFAAYLNTVHKLAMGAFAHQELPFDRLVEELKPTRDLSYHPLFQVSFTLQDAPMLMALPGLQAEPIEFSNGTSAFDLTTELWETAEGGLNGRFEYDTDLFDRTTIQRLMAHYRVLLKNLIENPDAKISDADLLTDGELVQLIQTWNDTEMDYDRNAGIHILFEQQVKQTPEKTAVIFQNQQLSYRQLNERANQLAHHLRKLGIQPDQFVGLCVERTLEMMVGLLGILKAGAAYLPMDPKYPQDRLAYMLEDTQAAVLLTQKPLLEALPDFEGQIICLDDDWAEISQQSRQNPDSVTTSANLAYVIHTSGSTGKPKGVLIPHGNVVNFLDTMRQEPGLGASDTLLAVTTLSFDIAVLELFLPITTGAKLVIVGWETAVDGRHLIRAMVDHHVTVMQATPATWQMLLSSGWQPSPHVKMLSGGEALPRKLANDLLQNGGELWNMYGPTETTIWSSVWRVKAGDDPILIGRPIANTQMMVLDGSLKPVPIGVTGELYIAGDGVARGYLNRPDLTEERFVANPFSNQPNARMYRTGDLARFGTDGMIECLGRVDFQVKVRGFRIELGEIESVLDMFTAVKQAVVIAQGKTAADKQLVAYYIPEEDAAPAVAELRAFLQTKLPQYMVPSRFVQLDSFPLTPNGKVNRLILPELDASHVDAETKYVAPRNELEARMVTIWENLLNVQPIGVTDNYFDLGGHSLMATRLFRRIEAEFDTNLSLATLIMTPTIEGLVEVMNSEQADALWNSLVLMQSGKPERPPLFLTHGAGGNILLYRDLIRHLGADQPVYGLQAQGLDGREQYLTRFEDMAARYIKEIREIQPHGPYYLGGYCLGGTLSFEMAKQLEEAGEEVAMVAMFETFNMHANPVLMTKKYKLMHMVQNWWFHARNIFELEPADMIVFLKEKASVSLGRLQDKWQTFVTNRKRGVSSSDDVSSDEASFPHIILDKINDKAEEDYYPELYNGRILLFRPKKDFIGNEDAEFGWNGLANEINVCRLDVNPRGMLVEPYVQELAMQVRQEIDDKIGERLETAV